MSEASAASFQGVFTALVTPMRVSDGAVLIDEAALGRLVEAQLAGGVQGLVACGTTGEAATLSAEEQARVIRIVVETAAGRVPVLAGVGSPSTSGSLSLGKTALSVGASGLLAVTPYYNRPPQEGLFQHFSSLCSLGAPLVLYNVPGRTGCDLLPETVARLVERPEIVALKEASGSVLRLQALSRLCGNRLTLLSGEDALNFALYCVGARGTISVLSNVAPQATVEVWQRFASGDLATALALHQRLGPLCDLLFCEPNPIPAKAALHRMGRMENVLRLPLVPMSPPLQTRLGAELSALGLLS